MSVDNFLKKLTDNPQEIIFSEVMDAIDSKYVFSACEFSNGDLVNEKNQNNGSCKVFSFAKINNLSEQQTLFLFGQYYRDDVLKNPEGDDHQNIRNFMKPGWSGISFSADALK